jgi:hypothetical protein
MKTKILFAIALFIGFSSCSDQILDEIDTNPNQVNDAPLKTLLTKVETSYVCAISGGNHTSTATQLYYATEQNGYVFGGNILENPKGLGGQLWNQAYLDLNDLNIIIQKAEESSAPMYSGIARILKALNFAALTDLFGDIPFSEAMDASVSNPKFDSSVEIYAEIQKLLDEAIKELEKEPGLIAPKNDDMIFGGNKTLWIKTAHAIKARLYNRLSNIDPTGSANDALSAISKSFANESENMTFSKFANTPENSNPFAKGQIDQPLSSMGSGIYKTMISFSPTGSINDDPRANIWFTKIKGQVVPAPNGTEKPDFGEPRLDGTLYSKPEIFKVRTAPVSLISYIELKFIEAEAQLRLGKKTDAYASYQAAVNAALKNASAFNPAVALTQEQINTYTSIPKVFMGADALTIQDIIYQKYIFFYQFQPIESYNDIRRTGLVPVTNPMGRVNRIPYPDAELSRNSNTPTDIDNYTAFDASTKVFWAKK